MNLYAEIKLMGDAYSIGFANGLSMCKSESSFGFKETERDESKIVLKNSRNHKIIVNTLKKSTDCGEITEVTTEFINLSDKPCTLEMLSSFAIGNVKADKIHRMQSFWSAEGKLRTETIADLHLEPSWNRCATRVEKFGNLGSMPVRKYFPFIALEDSESGKVLGIQLYSPASWQIELLCKESDELTVVGGIADRDFGHWTKTVNPGESFTTPKAVIAEGQSLYEVTNKLVKAQQPDISPVDEDMGIVFNEYCTTWGNPSFENVKKICDKLKGRGVKYLVIDSGWYGEGSWWWTSIGDWEVNQTKFPGGMKPIADYIRSCGMIPGLWFEHEALAKSAKYYNNPEYLVKRDGVPLTVVERRFWDMENEWVINYLSERVIGLLRDCGFGYLKVDYNDTMGSGCDGEESQGENLRRKVEASKNFFRKIKRELPDLVIENCSSGGHRLEPSMMELCSQASFSDAHETTAIPLIAANLHRVIKPSQSQIWAVLRASDSDNRIHYSICNTFLGRMCLSGDIYNLSDHQWDLVSEGMDFYKLCAPIIKDGETIHCDCSTKLYNNPTGSQLVIRKLGDVNLAVFHRFENSSGLPENFLEGKNVTAKYGEALEDFSAEAYIYTVK